MTQTGPDLVSAGYPISFPALSIVGNNATQANLPARSTLEYTGLAGAIATGTLVSSGVAACVAVPCLAGYPISKVTVWVTATAASTPTHAFAALYAGTGAAPALIAQTTDITTTAIAANAPFSFSFGSVQNILQSQVPNGFVYVAVSVTASTVPTVVTVAGPTIGAYGTMVPPTTSPLFFSATAGTALGGTAAATIASPSNVTAVPVVILS